MRRWTIICAAAVLLALAYTAWPFLALLQLGQAVRSGDVARVLERVDVAAIRQSIAFQLVDEGVRGAKVGRRLSPVELNMALGFVRPLVDQQLAKVIDAEAVRRILADGNLPASLVDELHREEPATDDRSLRLPRLPTKALADLRDWRFRSPVTFDVKIGDDEESRRWAGLRLRRSGLTWVLTEIRLPPIIVEQLKQVVGKRLRDAGL